MGTMWVLYPEAVGLARGCGVTYHSTSVSPFLGCVIPSMLVLMQRPLSVHHVPRNEKVGYYRHGSEIRRHPLSLPGSYMLKQRIEPGHVGSDRNRDS